MAETDGVATVTTSTFGDLLRQHRFASGFTQEELAEGARISVRGLSDLERGVTHSPRRYTVQALARALELSSAEESALLAAVRRARIAAPSRSLASGFTPPPVQTVLIADIRSYTDCMVEYGNEAGNALAMRFASMAGLLLKRRGGQVRALRSNEVLAVFPSPRQALYAAVELQQQCSLVDDEPLPVGTGLDAGELTPAEDGNFRGLALNLAARLCSVANPGEVLVSETVIHLAQKLTGLSYRNRGTMSLKEFPEPVCVFQVFPALRVVTEVHAPPPAQVESERERPESAARRLLALPTLAADWSAP